MSDIMWNKEKQGIAIALNLPEDDEAPIREKVFDDLTMKVH